jgi:hypothetical protein
MVNLKSALSGALLFPALALGAACATAQPAAAQTQDLPAYAHAGDATIHGVVRSIDGKYNITVRDTKGYLDSVTLHDGTVINPTGLTLAPGQTVTIVGRADGNTFAADEIDTPYVAYGYAYPVYPYAYPAWGYYPAFGVGFGWHHFGFGGRI